MDRRLEDAAKWAPGGTYRQIVTVISAAAAGNVSSGVGEFVQRAAVGYLQTLGVEKVKQIADDLDSETARAALQGIVGCAGAAASGGNCSAGALGASASVVLNNLINVASDTNSRDITPSEKEARMNLVSSAKHRRGNFSRGRHERCRRQRSVAVGNGKQPVPASGRHRKGGGRIRIARSVHG
ncbi:hypothetical protein ACPWR0_18935 [Pandoraea pneumonica]|uniref:hypothetical protein n=1 Tax=Pandoraea pneumonica TaxID=2508299 RepID=UPI003CF09006